MKTLIVDDRQLAVNALVQTMKEIDPDGKHVGLISSHEAISFLKSHDVDVAFLDVEMPDMNGLLLAQNLKEICPNLNLVFVTGHVEYAYDSYKLFASGYLMKPASVEDVKAVLENLRNPLHKSQSRVYVRCFGNFEIFVDDEPLVFHRTKEKELLAYLVDSKGAFCSTGELVGALWEDEEVTDSKLSQLRSFMADIRKVFEEKNLPELIIKEYSKIAIRPDKIDCDYYRFLDGDVNAVNSFMGEYMKQYSWAEIRLGELTMRGADVG